MPMLQASPFTPAFDTEVQRLHDYIKRERRRDKEVRKAAKLLQAKYGSLEYGAFAVLAKQWISESAREEIDRLSSIGERILSGQAISRTRFSAHTVQRRINEFAKSWGAASREILQGLQKRLDPSDVVRLTLYLDEMWFQKKQADERYNVIDQLSPKALGNLS